MTTSDTYREEPDVYAASRDTTEGRVHTVAGGDWSEFLEEAAGEDRLVLNFGPQHPSSHGVLRIVLELEGETIISARPVIGYLHTGIEKNTEYRTWTQGTTFVTRMDYLAPLFNETAYCMSVERLLGIEAPQRAQTIRVILMELNRISSHLVSLAAGGLEVGALTAMTMGFREREQVLDVFELVTGLRMNHAYIRPGGLALDLPVGAHLHAEGGQGDQVRGDPVELHDQHADRLRALRRLDAEQLLDGEAVAGLVEQRGQVVHPRHEGRALGPVAVLGVLLDPGVQVADHHPGLGHRLALEVEDQAEDAVGRGVLRAHVDDEAFLADRVRAERQVPVAAGDGVDAALGGLPGAGVGVGGRGHR